MEDSLNQAKLWFHTYYGNYFQMSRAGVYEAYKLYEITKEEEAAWYQELISQNAAALSIRSWDAVLELAAIAKNDSDSQILDHVISFAARHVMSSDSVVKLMFAENIVAIVKLVRENTETELLHRAYKTAADLLSDVISKPLVIDPGHELETLGLKDKRALNQRAANSIALIKELLAAD
ncbi:hypothetical protein [Paenibacillus sinopodophylli]|uniref:hypothetical protein n=1 Tax=Paenibacillus sinopodophylli TaxID=1837342 RepID=UPI00110CF817|nr:hypothetical protein [Paenibacillus sinopodophylli]